MQPVELKRVRTLYACVGEHETELSFEPNMIISNGENSQRKHLFTLLVFSASQSGAGMVGGHPRWASGPCARELRGVYNLDLRGQVTLPSHAEISKMIIHKD